MQAVLFTFKSYKHMYTPIFLKNKAGKIVNIGSLCKLLNILYWNWILLGEHWRVFCHLKNRWNWIRNQQHLRIRKSATHRTWAITECRNIGTCFPINNGSSVGSSVRSSYYLKWRINSKNIIYCKCVLLSLQLLHSKYVLLVWD